ncbi:Aste57867_12053 [Aphanomyces stellatus]|uniref:Aste57867_12053 protein n=1 Tax=Aphanomyces stellatus TaxID=120398 RepID=A0A485KV57_9STRA|nr:hypothetical protein As57867_012008 [Aphanomyces stellatus]VFT88908.1 Aste57867_12053 [Aphanomyces stellatus]
MTMLDSTFDLTDLDISALVQDGILDYSSAEDSLEGGDLSWTSYASSDDGSAAATTAVDPLSMTSTPSDDKTTKYLEKLYCMLEQCPPSIAAWTHDGASFTIYNSDALEKSIIPNFFKPIKFESFGRQLNSYGFKKTKTLVHHTTVFEFRHPRFVRGQSEQLRTIQRRRRRMQQLSAGDMADLSDMELRDTVGNLLRFVETLHTELVETKALVKALVDAQSKAM